MLTVHHLENSRSQRILWLLEELGVEYQIRHYKRDPKTRLAPPELRDVHPLGKAPVITDGDVTMAESGAIIEYLIGKYGGGKLVPLAGTRDRLAYTFWLHYAEGSLMTLMMLALVLNRIESSPMPFFARPIARGLVARVRNGYLDASVKRSLDYMESTLKASRWFAGENMSAADIQMSFGLEMAEALTPMTTDYPVLRGFLERIRALPAYQRALEKGGPYSLRFK